ncbi:hypothetical protein CSKR_110130 [Clonorchis sinensis]|uniref:Uncharacterized protein n=1 Tax=Clonorchis sinensis TaxID=79923 RepID=A0A3R7ERV8_CLOSI|nr:hypothetical protein CSKR_110130 [Clonorchis sinensis]
MDSDDFPISYSFTEQKKQRAQKEKQIRQAISESRKLTKQTRKSKHASKLIKKLADESTADFNSTNENVLSTKKGAQAKGLLQQPVDEFDLSTRFDVASHFLDSSEPVVEVDREDTNDTHKSASKKNHTHFSVSDNPESDEGYNGSDEQDRLKGMPASFQHDDDELDYSLICDVHNAERRESDVLLRSRAGKRRRRPGREGAFHVERLDKTNVEESACSQAGLFLKNALFSRLTCKGVRRAEPELLISLAKKQKARRKR